MESCEISVGGRVFKTSLSILRKYPDSMLSAMFSGLHNLNHDEKGRVFIDRDGNCFQYIIYFL